MSDKSTVGFRTLVDTSTRNPNQPAAVASKPAVSEVPMPSSIKSGAVTLDDVIKRKLVIDGDGVGDDRKIQNFLKSFTAFCSSEEFNKADDEIVFRKLIQQVKQMEYSARRTYTAIQMNEETKKVYNNLNIAIQAESEKTYKTIQNAKHLIDEEAKHRKHSMEYEALSKLIESKPDRKETEVQKQILEEKVDALLEMKMELCKSLTDREKQVKSLSFAVETLRNGIESDDSKPWGNVSPLRLHGTSEMETDAFPLEKELFLDKEEVHSPEPQNEETTVDDGITKPLPTVSSFPACTKDKYDDLSEESPEEGESED